ncbi:MAG: hypothetical protein KDA60_09095 [Planctomycetales bacterium]|nr:hypothetical protein [Planctomycetales bacterium]
MPRYMLLKRGDCTAQPQMTPEQMESCMKAWMEWMKQGTEAGWLVDPGSGLKPTGAVVNHDLSVTDGPYLETKELVGGYTIVEAANLAEACEYARQTMQIAGSGKIEVRELAQGG